MARDLSDTCAEEQATTQESPPKDGLWEQVRTLEEESGRLQAEVLSRDETIKLLEEQIKEMEGSHKAEKGELKKEITDLRSKIRLRKERIKELEKETRKKDERIDSQESIIKKLEAGAACRTMRLSNFAKDIRELSHRYEREEKANLLRPKNNGNPEEITVLFCVPEKKYGGGEITKLKKSFPSIAFVQHVVSDGMRHLPEADAYITHNLLPHSTTERIASVLGPNRTIIHYRKRNYVLERIKALSQGKP